MKLKREEQCEVEGKKDRQKSVSFENKEKVDGHRRAGKESSLRYVVTYS